MDNIEADPPRESASHPTSNDRGDMRKIEQEGVEFVKREDDKAQKHDADVSFWSTMERIVRAMESRRE